MGRVDCGGPVWHVTRLRRCVLAWGIVCEAAVGLVESLRAVACADRDGAYYPGWSCIGMPGGGHWEDPPREPPGKTRPAPISPPPVLAGGEAGQLVRKTKQKAGNEGQRLRSDGPFTARCKLCNTTSLGTALWRRTAWARRRSLSVD